ncbi:hypothetical protein J2S74_003471 [Evansella vedderi]|uniref:Uncharacterized protein n=1 Tax=Evansella vedderi TaxID=38282 RepID=A0ABT9ZXV9_9BACI|nr:hypothetical protein [Evansella vedderi]MDQ0256072.1 hypothetical protein [Evansella vedderi]
MENINELKNPQLQKKIDHEINGINFTKNFRSATAEDWYVFLPSYQDPKSGGAVGRTFIHYELQGNRDVHINTTIIFTDPILGHSTNYTLVYAVCDEIINRLVGYADTLLTVYAGENSYDAEYIRKADQT